jgi:hypothetical protein
MEYILYYTIGVIITYIILRIAVKLEQLDFNNRLTPDYYFATLVCSIIYPIFWIMFILELIIKKLVKLLK